MLKTENTNMNMSGTAYNNDQILANFNGSFGGGDDCYLNISIPYYSNAVLDKDILYADLESFIDQLLEKIVDLKD